MSLIKKYLEVFKLYRYNIIAKFYTHISYCSLAQQESQSLSQNVKLGLQFRYQNGQVQVNHNRFLGCTKDADSNLVIAPE